MRKKSPQNRLKDHPLSKISQISAFLKERKKAKLNTRFLADLDLSLGQLTRPEEIEQVSIAKLGTYLKANRCHFGQISGERFLIQGDWFEGTQQSVSGQYLLKDFLKPRYIKAFLTGQPLRVDDVRTSRVTSGCQKSYEALDIRSLLSIPIFHKGAWSGVLTVTCNAPRVWDDDEAQLLRDVAARVWLMIEEARTVKALRESEERFRHIADHSPGMVWVTDPKGACTFLSQSWNQFTGQTQEEGLGFGWLDAVHPDDRDATKRAFLACHSRREPFCMDYRLRRANGDYRWMLDSGLAHFNAHGEFQGYIGSVIDITDRQRNQEALKEAKESAESASRAKSAFVANMSHEIRTPLTAILGFTEFLMDPKLPENERLEAVQIIKRNGEMLLCLINDLLDLSKIEANRIEAEQIFFPLETLINEIISTMDLKAREKGLNLKVAYDAQSPPPRRIRSDPTKIRQILLNLIGNSVKFMSRGEILLTVSSVQISQTKARISYRVRDEGPGFTPENLARLFQPFTQGDSSMSRKHGGTGLGLFISKRLAQALNGDLTLLHSEPGKGATFEFKLEAETPPSPDHFGVNGQADDEPNQAAHRLEGLRVLLVEDVVDNSILISKRLKALGASVDLASNGSEALQKTLHGDYDVILMDLQMPVMNGYEATQKLRAGKYGKPIVAITAHAMREEREHALKSGFDDYLTKPLDRGSLLKSLRRIQSLRQP